MKSDQKLWTREELIIAINLYFKIPFGRLHSRNPQVIELAELLNRTPGSIAYKLVNFASLDPTLKQKGADHTSKLDKEIWNEFYSNWDSLPFESEKLLANFQNTTVENLNNIPEADLPKEGIERERLVKTRVNQILFRKSILSAYDGKCCITGISLSELLVAGHIRPWSLDKENRMNPENGLCLNSLHDKAYENGLISITPEYRIVVSKDLPKNESWDFDYFRKFEGNEIQLPKRFLPNPEFLKYHYNERFRK